MGRPRTYDDAHFKEVARVYRDGADATGRPTEYVAETFGVSKYTAAKWVCRCSDKGFLPPTSRGRLRVTPTRSPRYDRNQAILVLRAAGWSHRRIGRAFGISHERVRQVIGREFMRDRERP